MQGCCWCGRRCGCVEVRCRLGSYNMGFVQEGGVWPRANGKGAQTVRMRAAFCPPVGFPPCT